MKQWLRDGWQGELVRLAACWDRERSVRDDAISFEFANVGMAPVEMAPERFVRRPTGIAVSLGPTQRYLRNDLGRGTAGSYQVT